MNVLKPDKKSTIITLRKNGISQREISRKTKINRKMEEKRAIPLQARSACEPHREWIEDQVRLGRNAVAIYTGFAVKIHLLATDPHRLTRTFYPVDTRVYGKFRHIGDSAPSGSNPDSQFSEKDPILPGLYQ
jgi:hypothetical protein